MLIQAAAIVDTKAWATDSFEGNIGECMASMSEYIAQYAKSRNKGCGFAEKSEAQMSSFVNKHGHYALLNTINKAKVQEPHVFFDLNSATIPEFAEVAVRLASKVSASGAAERDHKDTKHIWNKKRNRMTTEKVERAKHRYSAIRLKRGFILADEVDASKEMYMKYWEPEDLLDPFEKELRLLQGQRLQANIRENTFFCFVEIWEHGLIKTDEATDATARFRLLNKYKGIFMRDLDEDYDEYRKVVDLEWSKAKVKDYGNKRGWVLVCELISPYHDAEIAMVTDDDRTSICEAYTINKLFFECVLAAPPNLQTRAIKNQAAAAGADAEAGPPEDD